MNDPTFIYADDHRILNLNFVISIKRQLNVWGEETGFLLEMSDGELITISEQPHASRINEIFFSEVMPYEK